jgi:hypothetical protein
MKYAVIILIGLVILGIVAAVGFIIYSPTSTPRDPWAVGATVLLGIVAIAGILKNTTI